MERLINENLIQDGTKSKERSPRTGLEVSLSSSPEAIDGLSAFADALNHDEPITSESLDSLKNSLKQAKIKLGNQEVTIEQAEQIYGSFGSFLRETYKAWGYDEETINRIKILAEIKSPKDEDYAVRKADVNAEKFGQFTLNPDTQGLSWETLQGKIFIPKLPKSLEGKPLQEVAEYLVKEYSSKYRFPGIEYWKFMVENPDKVPGELKDGNWYYNFGSLVRASDGHWLVPYARWYGSEWSRNAFWLDSTWVSRCRVVLLEI